MSASQFVARAILVAILVLFAIWSMWAIYSLFFVAAYHTAAPH